MGFSKMPFIMKTSLNKICFYNFVITLGTWNCLVSKLGFLCLFVCFHLLWAYYWVNKSDQDVHFETGHFGGRKRQKKKKSISNTLRPIPVSPLQHCAWEWRRGLRVFLSHELSSKLISFESSFIGGIVSFSQELQEEKQE